MKMNSVDGMESLSWRRRESWSHLKVQPSEPLWDRMGRWFATTMVRGRGETGELIDSVSESEFESASEMMPETVMTRGRRRVILLTDGGLPEANSSRFE